MLKKLSLILMACMLVFSFTAPGMVDAKGYKSSKKSYTPSSSNTTQTPNNGINKTEPAASKSPTGTAATPAKKPGFFSGGLMKGLMIGGLAGLLFGSLFGGMGFLGDLLGLMVNVLAIVVLFVVIRKIFVYFRDRKKFNDEPKRF
ncbi:hypothetical protein [Paenibacillus tyrfis]|uniref:Preprotein translocase subunit Tim44 n=1 Tax=Paenibacillus tyrfis TaxID=1501230 RepID=A0A081P0T8_9BACL|nr:hypothetical protein [Paenibacillus tyrfis]KEQ24311.1 preprotein translocase subunit Tim44 [Paenibacillus tyrfis]